MTLLLPGKKRYVQHNTKTIGAQSPAVFKKVIVVSSCGIVEELE